MPPVVIITRRTNIDSNSVLMLNKSIFDANIDTKMWSNLKLIHLVTMLYHQQKLRIRKTGVGIYILTLYSWPLASSYKRTEIAMN